MLDILFELLKALFGLLVMGLFLLAVIATGLTLMLLITAFDFVSKFISKTICFFFGHKFKSPDMDDISCVCLRCYFAQEHNFDSKNICTTCGHHTHKEEDGVCKFCGLKRCGACKGSGMQLCGSCQAYLLDTTDWDDYQKKEYCRYCLSSGTTTCSNCGGSGWEKT